MNVSRHLTIEPLRIRTLRRDLIRAVPRWPNDRASLRHMEHAPLREVALAYVNWAARYVPDRPRRVVVEPAVSFSPVWSEYAFGVHLLLNKVRDGEPLTPHLSLQPSTKGYVPKTGARVAALDKWIDKDFVLTRTGWHHFHLGLSTERRGHIKRTDYLLFAEISREEFKAIGLFNHDVFTIGTEENANLSQLLFLRRSRIHPPGTVYVAASVMSSGHATHIVLYSDKCVRTALDMDLKLDGPELFNELYQTMPARRPTMPKFRWMFMGLDFGVLDAASGTFFSLVQGWL